MAFGLLAGGAGVLSSARSAENRAADEQTRALEQAREILAPYISGGEEALGGMMALLGLSGADAQQSAISGIEGSPVFQSMVNQGEDAILANASATGGLRGGNVQQSLSEFRPQVLSGLINKNVSTLGGIASLGGNAASNLAGANIQTGADIGNRRFAGGMAQTQFLSDAFGTLAGFASGGAGGAGGGF